MHELLGITMQQIPDNSEESQSPREYKKGTEVPSLLDPKIFEYEWSLFQTEFKVLFCWCEQQLEISC